MTKDLAYADYSNPESLRTLVQHTLEITKAKGASSASASAGENSGLSVVVRMGDVETIEHHRSKHMGVTVYFGQRTGTATTSDLSPKSIQETVAAACRIARYTQEDNCAGLADPSLMATSIPDLELYRPWQLSPQAATDLALETEQAARDTDNRITNSEGAAVTTYRGCSVYGNTHGFIGDYAGTRHSISATMIAEDGTDKQRDYWYSTSRYSNELSTPKTVGERAAIRAIKRLNAVKISTRDVPILFPAEIATHLFSSFTTAVKGSSLYRDASFLVDSLGDMIFSDHVQVHERPLLIGGLGSSPFDGEGVQTTDRTLVKDGILQSYVLDSYSARKLNMETTGNAGGIHNLVVASGSKGFDGLVREMDTGLVVSELIGSGINMVTGDYSRGAAGFWVENGELQYPVHEITIAGNLRDMFRDIVAIGNDIEDRSNYKTGSVLIGQMTVAGD